MKLEANAELFRERVREAPISGNIDNPEGGFDALVQVILMFFFYLISILCSGGKGISKIVSLQRAGILSIYLSTKLYASLSFSTFDAG